MKALCPRALIAPNTSKGVDNYILVDRAGTLYIYRNQCPHLGIELQWVEDTFLDQSGEFIQCSSHGALFTIDTGLCIRGPCNGASLKQIHYTLENDQVYVVDQANLGTA
ncbi:MAG: Rieske (2Fe-2S) protein [Pseudomonadales bacterium]